MAEDIYRDDLNVDAVRVAPPDRPGATWYAPWRKTEPLRNSACRTLQSQLFYHIRGIASAEGVAYLETQRLS